MLLRGLVNTLSRSLSSARGPFQRTLPNRAAPFSTTVQRFYARVVIDDADVTVKKKPAAKKSTGAKSTKSTKAGKKAAKPKKATKAKAAKKPAKKVKKVVKPKKPAAPKKVVKLPKQITSIWQLFNINQIAATKANLSSGEKISVAEQAKANAVKYRSLSESERASLQRELDEHKAKFEIEYREALANLTPDQIRAENRYRLEQRKKGKSSRHNLRDPNKPKAPPNGFFLYLQDKRNDASWLAEAAPADADARTKLQGPSKKAGEEWRALDDAGKAPWQSRAAELKASYDQALASYKNS